MNYRRRASPLHAARAAVGCAYCASLLVAALVVSSPIALGAVVLAIAGAGVGAGVGRELRRAALFALPLGVAVMVINALVVRDGLTVIARLGDLPVFGQTDITLEATVAGAVLGLRAVGLVLCGALYTAAVDPDQVLRLFRRLSFHSALTATLATRMVPVLARDARRLAEAQRCRPGPPPSRARARARGHRRRAGPRARRGRRAGGARIRCRPPGAAQRRRRPAVVPARCGLCRLGGGDRGSCRRRPGGRAGAIQLRPGCSMRRCAAAAWPWRSGCWCARCSRSPTAGARADAPQGHGRATSGASSDERPCLRARDLHLSRCPRAGARGCDARGGTR